MATLSEDMMVSIFGRAMIDELSSTGFNFDGTSGVMTFIDNELMGERLNLTDYFLDPCSTSNNATSPVTDCLNQTKITSCFQAVLGHYIRNRLTIVLPIICVIAVISVVSNVLGIRAVIGIRHKLPRHWVLVQLSVADCLLAPLNVVKVTSEVLAFSTFDEFFRTYFNSVWQTFFLLCPLALFFLALDNVIAVVSPFFYNRHSGSGARVIMLSVTAATLFCIVLFVSLLHVFGLQGSQTVQIVVATVLLGIIAITVTLYLALAIKAEIIRRSMLGTSIPAASKSENQREMLRSRMKTTATTLSIVMTLAGFWSPFTAYLLIPEQVKFSNVPVVINFLCVALALFQLATAIDPIVYCCRMVEVRRSLVATVVPQRCRNRFSNNNKRQQQQQQQHFNNNNNNQMKRNSLAKTQLSEVQSEYSKDVISSLPAAAKLDDDEQQSVPMLKSNVEGETNNKTLLGDNNENA